MKEHTYPSLQDWSYDPESQTIACCESGIPLLWLAIFRTGDLRFDFENSKGPAFRRPAPVIHRSAVTKRLATSLPRVEALFERGSSLQEYASYLREAIAAIDTDYQYLTIEMPVIAAESGHSDFYGSLRKLLDFLGGEPDSEIRKRVVSMCGMHFERTVLPVSAFIDGAAAREDWENLARLLGERHDRDLPWIN
jgi:hypothetical protein